MAIVIRIGTCSFHRRVHARAQGAISSRPEGGTAPGKLVEQILDRVAVISLTSCPLQH
jgi:hypothetical protein